MAIEVRGTTDPAEALNACGAFLEASPVRHNVALSIVHQRIASPADGRYWWVVDDGGVCGYGWQSPPTFSVGVTPMPVTAVGALVERVHAEAPSVPGVIGEAGTAAAFAGRWTELTGRGASPHEGQRLYELAAVDEVPTPHGAARPATPDQLDLACAWLAGFERETGSGGGTPDTRDVLRRFIERDRLWFWHDEEPRAMAAIHPPVGGVVRVGPVYTPPEHRGHGGATAVVAHVSAVALAAGAVRTVLYTQLANATSNGIYRRIGYRAVAEVLAYRF